jgi:hypothetical protein
MHAEGFTQDVEMLVKLGVHKQDKLGTIKWLAFYDTISES